MYELDLATRFIDADHNIFVVHPGAAKKFYFEFAKAGMVFLDLPGAVLDCPIGRDAPELLWRLGLAEKIAAWRRTGANPEREPSRDPNQYRDTTRHRGRAVQLTSIHALYKLAKKGDLVVCPGPGYMTKVLIGEVIDDFDVGTFAMPEVYGGDRIPARRVRWLSDRKPKAHFSPDLITMMQNRRAIIKIYNAGQKREIYNEAYVNYVLPDESTAKIYVRNQHMNLWDFSDGTRIVRYFTAMYNAQTQGRLEDFLALDYDNALRQFRPADFDLDIGISINSPGFLSLKTAARSLPLFIAIMLTVTGADIPHAEAADLVISNSAAAVPDACQVEIQEQYREAMRLINFEEWQTICQRRIEDNAKAQLGTDLTLKEAQHVQRGP